MVIRLQDLPDRMIAVERRLTSVESQIVHLAKRMDDGFSATKAEIYRLNDETKAEMRKLNDETKAEMRKLNDESKAEMHKLNKETMAQARMLYEDLKEAIKTIGEGPAVSLIRRRPKTFTWCPSDTYP